MSETHLWKRGRENGKHYTNFPQNYECEMTNIIDF